MSDSFFDPAPKNSKAMVMLTDMPAANMNNIVSFFNSAPKNSKALVMLTDMPPQPARSLSRVKETATLMQSRWRKGHL